jgi:hypothetical protein
MLPNNGTARSPGGGLLWSFDNTDISIGYKLCFVFVLAFSIFAIGFFLLLLGVEPQDMVMVAGVGIIFSLLAICSGGVMLAAWSVDNREQVARWKAQMAGFSEDDEPSSQCTVPNVTSGLEIPRVYDLVLGRSCIGMLYRYTLRTGTRSQFAEAGDMALGLTGVLSGGIEGAILKAMSKRSNRKGYAATEVKRAQESGATLRKRLEQNPGSFVIPLQDILSVRRVRLDKASVRFEIATQSGVYSLCGSDEAPRVISKWLNDQQTTQVEES